MKGFLKDIISWYTGIAFVVGIFGGWNLEDSIAWPYTAYMKVSEKYESKSVETEREQAPTTEGEIRRKYPSRGPGVAD